MRHPQISLISDFVLSQATPQVPHVKQDVLTLSEHLRSPSVCDEVSLAQS